MPNSYVEAPVAPTQAEQLSFLSILNFILRNLVWLLVPAILMTALLVIRAGMAPKTYTSTAIFSAGEVTAPGGSFLGLSLPGFISGKGATFYVDLMTSPAVLDPLVEATIQTGPGKQATLVDLYGGGNPSRPLAKNAAMSAVGSKIHTKISPTSGWVTLSVTAEGPTLAVELARAAMAAVDQFNTNAKKTQSIADRRFTQDRLAEIGAELRSAEDDYQKFRETNKDISSPALSLQNDRLMNVVNTRRSLYQTILSTYERERLDQDREARVLTVIGPPSTPIGPDRIAYKRTAAMGFFVGGLLGAMLAFVKDYFRWLREHPTPEYAEFTSLRSRLLGRFRRGSSTGATKG